MALEFAERIRRIPVYPAAGGYAEQAPLVRLASNESPYPPLPAVREAIDRALRTLNRYPDPSNSLLRQRLSDRYGVPDRGSRSATAPATSCSPPARRCSSPAPSSSTPGRRSPSTRTSAPPRARARSPSRSTRAQRHDLAGDAARDHRRDAPGDRLQPQQPHQHRAAARRHRRVRRRGAPARVRDRRRGLLRVQPARRPRRLDRPARAPPQPRAAAHLLQGPRPVRAARRLRAVRLGGAAARASTRCASRSSATPSPRPPRSRRSPTRTPSSSASRSTIAERISVDERLRALGLEPADSQANFCWFELGEDATRSEVMQGLPSAACSCAAAARSAPRRPRCASPTARPRRTRASWTRSPRCSGRSSARIAR